jgi:hypothetical protein
MGNIAKSLRAEYGADRLYLLVAKRNSGSFTYDGIELGGERVCAEIEEELSVIEGRGGKIKKLSVIGYSLGGLVARYAVGLLYAKGVLDTLECMVGCRLCTIPLRPTPEDGCNESSPLTHLFTELHHLRDTPPWRPHAAQGLAQPHVERSGRTYPLHVRPPALHN